MKNKTILIFMSINILLGSFSSHATPELQKFLQILACIRANNTDMLKKYPANEVLEVRTIYRAVTDCVIASTDQNNTTCTINGHRVNGNFSIIGGCVFSGNFINLNNEGSANLTISGSINNLYAKDASINCSGDISNAETTNGSITANVIHGNATTNNGSVKVSGNIYGSVTANNGSITR